MALYTRKRARRSLVDTLRYRALSQVVTILGYVVLVRGMSEHDFGIFNLLYAFIPLASTVASLGLEQTLRRFQPEYLQAGNRPAAAWLVRFVASARFGVNVVLLAVILLTWNLTAPLFDLTPYRPQFALFCLLVLLHFQTRILQLTLGSHMLHRFSVGSMAVLGAVKLVAYLGLASLDSLTLEHAILADTLAYAVMYAMLQVVHRRQCALPAAAEKFRPAPEERKRLFRYGLYNNFNDVGTLVLTSRSDSFFIAAFLNPVAVGAYAFYTRLNEMTVHLLPTRLFDNVLQPMFFATKREEAQQRIPRYFSLFLNTNLAFYLPIFAYSAAYHAEIVTVLFGGKFLSSSPLLPLVLFFTTFNVISNPVTLVAQYAERVPVLLWSKIFAVYNVVAMLALLPVAGLYGAAIATGTAQVGKNLFVWWFVRDTARWTNFPVVVAMSVLIWGGVIGLCYGLKMVLPAPALVHMLAGAALCGIGVLLYLRSPAVSRSDREILSSVLSGREGRILRRLGILMEAPARPSTGAS